MSGFWDDVKGMVGSVAPTIASALGGPLAGVAVQQLSRSLLGREDASEQEVHDALMRTSPDDLVRLKEIEAEFKAKMRKAGIELERIAADDRESARRRQVEMRDWTPSVLGAGIILGFFAVLALVMFNDLPEGAADIFKVLLGALGGMCTQVGNYFFGSSRGSKIKDGMIADLKKKGA